MKKTITVISIMFAITLLVGCGQQETAKGLSNKNNNQKVEKLANLKTYFDKKYNFEFQYPETWTLDESNSKIYPKSPKNCGSKITGESKESTCLDSISFELINNSEKLFVSDFWKKEYDWEKELHYKNLKEQKIGNATTFTATTISGYDGTENYTFWLTLPDGNFFTLSSSYLVDDQKKVFDDIVSSFKFTK